MMPAWERLTPEAKTETNDLLLYRKDPQGHVIRFGHEIGEGELQPRRYSEPYLILPGELDALATKSDAARALVETMRKAEWSAYVLGQTGEWWTACPWCRQLESEGHAPDCEFVSTLAPFKDAPDA